MLKHCHLQAGFGNLLFDLYVKMSRWTFGYPLINVCPTFPAQRSPAQPRPTRPSPAQLRPAQSSPGHANPAQPSPVKASSTQLSPAQASPAEPKCFCYVSNSRPKKKRESRINICNKKTRTIASIKTTSTRKNEIGCRSFARPNAYVATII